MARIVTFQVLGGKVFFGERELSDGEESHPNGSIGYFRLQAGGLVRCSGSGQVQYRFRFAGDGEYRAGPEFAHRVKSPEEERDPIKRVLREVGVPVSKIRRLTVGEGYETSLGSTGDLARGTYEFYGFSTDGDKSKTFCLDGGDHQNFQVTHGSYVVEWGTYRRNQRRWICQVVVWPHCDPLELKTAIQAVLGGRSR
jgi:hypothetical protein